MTRSIRLRRWQKRALDRMAASGRSDFLAVATPGAGKTTFALTAAARALGRTPGQSLVVVAPTSHLKVQWAAAAARVGLLLDAAWSTAGRLPADHHGVVVTYQQVATAPEVLATAAAGAFVVLDEIHHAGDERSWGAACRTAFAAAGFRLALSGTPFRSDTRAIPFVEYHLDEALPDFEYGYADALRDGRVVRPVFFPRIGGQMEWVAPDGQEHAATFDDALDRTLSSQRLRTALSPDGEWLPAVLGQANRQLLDLRRHHPDAAGLVIATDHEHARAVADLLDRRFRARATVALSDDPQASARIARFAASDQPWIVAVRMVSEGVDIPRLRVGVYATTTTTELFFRQAVGRFVRWTGAGSPDGDESAHLYIPDDPRLRTWAHTIAEQRRHNLRRDRRAVVEGMEDDGATGAELDAQVHPDDAFGEEQLSLFAALSAVAHEGPHPVATVLPGESARAIVAGGGHDDEDDLDDAELVVALEPPPLPGGLAVEVEQLVDRRRALSDLRKHNAGLVAELVRFTGLGHAEINRTLNREVGIRRIDDATVEQLEKRAAAATRWMRRL